MSFLFTFADVSKTGIAVGILTVISDEIHTLFHSGIWGDILALPDFPFLYTVGSTELVSGLGILGYVFGVITPKLDQWCASITAFITFIATLSHVVCDDPIDKVVFCVTLCTLWITLNLLIANSRGKSNMNWMSYSPFSLKIIIKYGKGSFSKYRAHSFYAPLMETMSNGIREYMSVFSLM